jgi:hypothetical protein
MNSTVDKFKAVVHFIIANCEDPNKLGATKLNKILWYSDTYAFKAQGVSVTGSEYLRRKRGPVPARILQALNQLESEGKISITHPDVPFQVRIFKSLEGVENGSISTSEKEIIQSVSKYICDEYTAGSISELSHDEVWDAAVDGEPIPLEATLVSVTGDYRPQVQNWANQVLSTYC